MVWLHPYLLDGEEALSFLMTENSGEDGLICVKIKIYLVAINGAYIACKTAEYLALTETRPAIARIRKEYAARLKQYFNSLKCHSTLIKKKP